MKTPQRSVSSLKQYCEGYIAAILEQDADAGRPALAERALTEIRVSFFTGAFAYQSFLDLAASEPRNVGMLRLAFLKREVAMFADAEIK